MGEKEDGRKGLVPSNFVDRVVSDLGEHSVLQMLECLVYCSSLCR